MTFRNPDVFMEMVLAFSIQNLMEPRARVTEEPLVMNLEVEIRVETRVAIQTLRAVLTQMQTTTMQQQPYKA